MKHRVLRIVLAAVLTAVCIAALGGCMMSNLLDRIYEDGYTIDHFDDFDDYPEYTDFTDMRESVSEGYFKLTIHTDKDTFAQGETIGCIAELTYIGDEDSITVYPYGDPITMEMMGKDIWYTSNDTYSNETLTLKKGVPIQCTLAECLPKSSSVLPGKYEIDACVSLSLSPDDAVSYNNCVSAVIVVEE